MKENESGENPGKIFFWLSVASILLLIACGALFVQLEMFMGIWGARLFTLLAIALNIVTLVHASRNKFRKTALLQGVLIVGLIVSLYFAFSQYLLCGKLLAREGVADAPGFMDVEIYQRGCIVYYGGIFGVTQINYASYTLQNDSLIVPRECRLNDVSHAKVFINGKQYILINQ